MLQYVLAALQRMLAMFKLAEADAVDGVFEGSKMFLYQNTVAPSLAVLLADFAECTFTGYARSAVITWGSIVNSGETGLPYMPGDTKTFACTGGADQNVAGYGYISADVPPVLLAYRNFPTSKIITNGQNVVIIPRIALASTAAIPDTDPQIV